MASRNVSKLYKDFVRVCEKWPVNNSRPGRDFGENIHTNIKKRFVENTIKPSEGEPMVAALLKISDNYYRNKYPRVHTHTYTNLTGEEYADGLSNESQSKVQAKKTWLEKLLNVKKIGERERDKKAQELKE